MADQLVIEDGYKPLVHALFMPHYVQDISADVATRKEGTDFWLTPKNSDGTVGAPLRCENKFESYATGRQALELVSVDRSRSGLVPGWMYTSMAAWLLSWFPSGELLAVPMDALRDLILPNPARNKATSTRNPAYLSWNVLENLTYVLDQLPDARWLDLREELGLEYDKRSMLRGSRDKKKATVDELVSLMRTLPPQSTPRKVSQDELRAAVRELAPLDFFMDRNAEMRSQLTWL